MNLRSYFHPSPSGNDQADRAAARSLRLGTLPAALLSVSLLSLPVSAQIMGGTWVNDPLTSGSCAEDAGGNSYIGECKTTEAATGADVTFDDPTKTFDYLIGGLSLSGDANDNEVALKDSDPARGGDLYGGYSDEGEANRNTVTISGGLVEKVFGGYSETNNATGNNVEISGGIINSSAIGGASDTGNVSDNTVVISGGELHLAYGGISDTGTASDNTVVISGGELHRVYGGWSDSNVATGNTVMISDGKVNADIKGGNSDGASATFNKVLISGGELRGYIAGGSSGHNAGDATNNYVEISGDTLAGVVLGGHSSGGEASSNTVAMSGGEVSDDVYGGDGKFGASSNTVEISGGVIKEMVYGGRSNDGHAVGNAVSISEDDGATSINQSVYGGHSTNGNATDNRINISGGIMSVGVLGGFSETGKASSNTVVISGGAALQVFGGWSDSNDVTDNTVEISDGNVRSDIYGGYSVEANATDNKVLISGGELRGYIMGGDSGGAAGDATNNYVEISGGTIAGGIFGGTSDGAEASNNTVAISGGEVSDNVYGGDGEAAATSNTVEISGGVLKGVVYGGHSEDGNAAGNTVSISEDDGATSINKHVYGGYSANGNATGNHLNISSGTIQNMTGGLSNSGEASGNIVDISGGAINWVYGGSTGLGGTAATNNKVSISGNAVIAGKVHGGYGRGVANNTVDISGGTIGSDVYGGSGFGSDPVKDNKVFISGGVINSLVRGGSASGSGDAIGNMVDISGGTVNATVFGSHISSPDASASNNTVNVSGGHITGSVYGSFGFAFSSAGNATENTVHISGGQIDQSIYGGSGAVATHNRVILSGAPTIGGSIYGGNQSADVTGNTLEIRSKGLNAASTYNFEQYHFLLPSDIQADDVMLTLGGGGNPTDISNTQVGVAMQSGGTLQTGDQVTLIRNDNGLNTDGLIQTNITAYQGISLEYEFDLGSDSNNLYATTRTVEVRDQTKAPLEGRVGAMAFTQQGADMIAGAAMEDIRSGGTGAFGMIAGSDSRYNTGSHVDVDGVTLLLGAKKGFQTQSGSLAAGAFFEAGWGNYDTYNNFGDGNVRGTGSADYYGVGVLLRHDWKSGLYAEGSLRGGRISSDWSSKDMGVANASYDISAPYYGAHLGLGHIIALSERTSLDLSAKYFWAHQGSETTDIAGDPYRFDAVDSQRTRLGAQLNYAFNDHLTGYAGAAWEREYDGDARATVYGKSAPSASLKGNTGVFEVGMVVKPNAKSPLSVNLGVQGYTGERKGAGGSLDVNWAF